MGVATGVDAFDGRSPSPTPVRSSIAKGANAPAPSLPDMTGTPTLRKFDAAKATGATTLQAADSRPTTSALRPTRAPVSAFGGGKV